VSWIWAFCAMVGRTGVRVIEVMVAARAPPASSAPAQKIKEITFRIIMSSLWRDQGSSPKIATSVLLVTKTFPSATIGTTDLLPAPYASRLLAAWLLL